MEYLLLALGAVVLMYQVYVSGVLLRSGELTRFQLWAQLGVTWLVPLVGGVACHWFLRLQDVRDRRRRSNGAADTLETAENIPMNEHAPSEGQQL
jgi:hypothetical protein